MLNPIAYSFSVQPRDDPLTQLSGVNSDAAERLMKGGKGAKNQSAVESLRHLRSLERAAASTALNRVLRGKSSVENALNDLYGIPVFSVAEATVHHEVEKATSKSKGRLKLKLEFQRDEPKGRRNRKGEDASHTLVLLLGSFRQCMVLGDASLSVSRGNGTWTSSKEIEFDWDAANADGGEDGGRVVLRLLWEEVRGFDAEMTIPIN